MLIRALCLGKIILRQSLQQNSWKTFVMTSIMFGYYWDRKQNYMIDYCSYDTRKAEQFCTLGREYLKEVFPQKYNEQAFFLKPH